MTTLSPYDPEIGTLWRAIAASGARSVAVVSGGHGEGSTMIASALARRAGIEGVATLLADLNTSRPAVARLLGLRPRRGEVVKLASLGMSVLAAPDREDLEAWRDCSVLANDVHRWQAEYGLIVFDAAPVLADPSAPVRGVTAAAAADVTVIVMQNGQNNAQAVLDLRSRLVVAGARLLATVTTERDEVSLLTKLEPGAARAPAKPARPSGLAARINASMVAAAQRAPAAAFARVGHLLPAQMRLALRLAG